MAYSGLIIVFHVYLKLRLKSDVLLFVAYLLISVPMKL